MEGALSHITAVPSSGSGSNPKAAYFNGDGVTLVFDIVEAEDIAIQSVYVGGQRWVEGVGYNKDNALKRITFIAPYIPEDEQVIHVTYFTDVSVNQGVDISNLTPAQLQALAEDIGPYLI